MKTNHTPAPWSFGHNIGVYAEGDAHIADISPSRNFDETLANAKLIAAAPELLEALFELMNSINPHSHPSKRWTTEICHKYHIGSKTMPNDESIIKAIAAIKKATE